MNPETDPDADGADPLLATRSDAFARIAGWFTLAVGTLVLLGWIVGSEHLKAAVPDIRGMKVNAALAFLLAGISLALQVRSRPGWPRAIARACAVGVLLIGALTLAEYVFVWRSGIDEWLFRDPASALPGWEPGRMPVLSTLNFVLLGAAPPPVPASLARRRLGVPGLVAGARLLLRRPSRNGHRERLPDRPAFRAGVPGARHRRAGRARRGQRPQARHPARLWRQDRAPPAAGGVRAAH